MADITEGHGAVDDAWNSIDANDFNDLLKSAIDTDKSEFEICSYAIADISDGPEAPVAMLAHTDLARLLGHLTDTQNRHYEKDGVDDSHLLNAEAYSTDFYAFMDKMSGAGFEPPEDYLSGLLQKILIYSLDSVPLNDEGEPDKAWLNAQVDEIVDDLLDDDFRDDFIDIARVASKLLIQTDYPLWVDEAGNTLDYENIDPTLDRNLMMGNAVQGTNDLVAWLNRIVHNPDTRQLLHSALQSMVSIFDPYRQSGDEAAPPDVALTLRELAENLEDYFTVGGEHYETDPVYNENSEAIYSDAQLGQTIREFMPLMQQLFIRSDRPNAIISNRPEEPPVYPLDLMTTNLRSIGFNPNTESDPVTGMGYLERSIYDLLRYDSYGRDRETDAEAWPASFFESLMFLTHAGSHHGWRDGGDTTEVDGVDNTDSRDAHGHGAYAEELTVNDSLFSIGMPKLNVQPIGAFGAYDLAMKDSDGNNIYRSKSAFTLGQVDQLHTGSVTGDDIDYRFFFNPDYGVLESLAGPGPGDLGAPDGGNPDGQSLGMNEYIAYAPNGLHETQLSAWSMGWSVRACFQGEGPYYYADPEAEVVTVDGEHYYKYLRPDGKTYALVSMDYARYLYPTEEGDVQDLETEAISYNDKRQRDNRYKSVWYSDYFMVHLTDPGTGDDHFVTLDNSSGDALAVEIDPTDLDKTAGRLIYYESIDEDDPKRACSSPEEAFFRNFQWVQNEKKMVLVIPMHMALNVELLNMPVVDEEAALFEVMEAHGWSGLATLRKYRDNRVWAKKGTTGYSKIPGDYRIEVASVHTGGPLVNTLLGENAIYRKNMDCGNATPSIVGHNLQALYRLGFPRSPLMYHPETAADTAPDRILGSQDFEVGDENWQQRNAFGPVLFSLLAGLREYTPAYDPDNKPGINAGIRTVLNQIAILIKPLFYYSRGGSETGAPETWVPRVYGTNAPEDIYQGYPFLKSSAYFYDKTPDTWFGSWEERRFYQPAVMKTLLNVMIDNDPTDPEKRCDGILPVITRRTQLLTHVFELLMDPNIEAPPLEQIVTAVKYTPGPMTAINADPVSGKGMVYPQWMFAKGDEASRDIFGAFTHYTAVRDEDLILDDLLDDIVGHDTIYENAGDNQTIEHEGYGLAHYPDDKPLEEDWQDFYDTVDTLADLLHESSPTSITENGLHLLDRIFARDELYTAEEIAGTLYTIGKLFGQYDPALNQWVYQGQTGFDEVYNLIARRLPDMNTTIVQAESGLLGTQAASGRTFSIGDHYYAQLILLTAMTDPDGLISYLMNTASTPANWGTIFADLNGFLEDPDVTAVRGRLWTELGKLLRDLGKAVGGTQSSAVTNNIIEDYGFQIN